MTRLPAKAIDAGAETPDPWQDMKRGATGAPFFSTQGIGGNQPPQWRTGPQSICTKFDRE